jgi:hypothetical protein|tara:strand:+ start:4220 stop:4591 length:372 start_codon:yes stop_codon:yes gene_type:complete
VYVYEKTLLIGQASSSTVTLKVNGLFNASAIVGNQLNVAVGLLVLLFEMLKEGIETALDKPDQEINLFEDEPIDALIEKLIESISLTQKFKESSKGPALVTSTGKPLKPLKTGGRVVHDKTII